MAGIIGGAVGGAISGGLSGGWKGALIGGALGGALGGVGGWAMAGQHYGVMAGMFAGGLGVTAATGSWDSFAGGLVGGIAGALAGNGILNAYSQQFSNFRAGNGFVSNAARGIVSPQNQTAQATGALNATPGKSIGMYRRPVEVDKVGFERAHPFAKFSDDTYMEIEAVRQADGSSVKEVLRGPLTAMSKATQQYMATNPVPDKVYSVDTTTFTNNMANYIETNYGKPYAVDTFGRFNDGRYTDSRELIDVLDRS